ncbi:MAG: TaqI-like C-terminal specificity domain-containing protein [Nitrospirota bacterium]|nr:TaqI-like C-terminal specificity domain-containing protein [Nitrospirota bacterium]
MNAQQARELIAETFPQAFDKGRFRNFAINLLDVDVSRAQAWQATDIKDAFKDHVARLDRLGTYTSPDKDKLDVLIVYLTAGSKLERARTGIRNFVADHLKTRENKDAALVAFVSPTEKQWRFSYVKMEYAAVEKEDGKVGVHTKLTPARRSSYLVGEGESCHTAQSRFIDLLQNTTNRPTLTQIEDAFNVEAVTKEFFEQYKALFLDLKDELDKIAKKDKTIGAEFAAKKVDTADFAKKLLGQIVFLYFLQKKGWLGLPKDYDWGQGPRNFLRQLFAGQFSVYDNFFNDILEPLFYDTLATDRGHQAWCKTLNCRIPFLNGGLFEPLDGYDWQKTDIVIPNSLFSNTKTTPAGDTGTGILDVFNRYNFTVNESEPLEKEVAIDPEMLGKVFENLLGVKERKSKGSFYTPREIVHFMCQESLINYLDTALNNDTKTVPREDIETFIHSGDQASHYEAARVEGTSYQRKLPKSIETHARQLDDKLAEIAVCDPAIGSGAFPVGMMQEIVRARSALTPYFNDVHDRTAYLFKRHAIQNCLYGVDIDPGAVEIAKLRLWLSLVVDEDDVKQVKPLPNLDYKIVTGNALIGFPFDSQRLQEVEQLKVSFFEETDHETKAHLKNQIDNKINECFRASKKSLGYEVNFDFKINFSEIFHGDGGFDICIANPPYGAKFSKEEKQLFLKTYRHQDYQLDSYLLFLERAFSFLCLGGVLAFIIPNPWLTNLKLEKIRRFIFEKQTVRGIAHYSKKMFEAVVDTEVVIIQKAPPIANSVVVRIVQDRDSVAFNIVSQDKLRELNGEPVNIFLDERHDSLLDKLKKSGELLGDVCKVAAGMKPYEVGKGSPPQTQEILSARIYDATYQKDKFYRPLLRGRDIERYLVKWDGTRWIKYGNNLAAPRKLENFTAKKKIVIRQTGDSLVAALDESQFICMNNMHTINSGDGNFDLLYLLGLINSSLLNWYFQCMNPEKGEALAEIKKEHVEKLPIVSASPQQQARIIALVDKIITAKKKNEGTDTTALEREIDQLVCELYQLTKDEKAIVQSAAK